jgi:hypothetical protein
MSLIPTTTDSTQWTPPQAKLIGRVVAGGLLAGGVILAVSIFNHLAPGAITAANLLTTLLGSMTHMLIAGVILAGVGFLAYEILFGDINRLLGQAYSSMINKMTWSMLNIDPLTPLHDYRKQAVAKKKEFDDAFASFDGTIVSLTRTRDKFAHDSATAEAQAKQAKTRLDGGDASMATTFQSLAYQAGKFKESAGRFDTMVNELSPVRTTIVQLQRGAEVMIANIDTDIEVQTKEWDAQKDMATMNQKARGIMKGGDGQQLAQMAAQLIETKYAGEMGRLNNLADTSKSLLDSIDLSQAAYSQDLLDKWQQESAPAQITSSAAPMPLITTQSDAYAKLVR